ncbi:hypothetical protein M9458_008688, partial [Cirrhinus mrigala]
PELPFTVEVDASTTRVGAVLSQAVGEPPLLHPCAFLQKLSPVEQNYNVGNRELLAIKLALEEWRHWLEGSIHPFTIITDHKHLQYLREAKRLNPRQAQWALFFTRFNFQITYRPGSKNVPADALSRQFSPDHPAEPESILPSNLILSPIIWETDDNIRQATLQEIALLECPEGKIFVPHSQRLPLLGAAHQSLGSGHPGSQQTPLAPSDPILVAQYVQSCSVCAMSTSPCQLPTGKLVLLPIPQRPWSHIGVDFVTDLPSSEGNTCIMVVVDRFSKMCKFFPLRGLPTAMEAAQLLFQQLFRHFSLPEEIVSDRGPQFISHIWKAFFKLLGVSVNLSSGYHPQGISPRYIGPFKILRQINDVTFQLQLPPRYRNYLTLHVSLLKPFYFSATETPGTEAEPPPPEVLDQPSIYTVHEILDSRRRGGHLEYLVDWEGYGPEERSWVPRDDILDPMLLSDFHRDHPDRPAPRSRGCPRRRVRASGAAPGGGATSICHTHSFIITRILTPTPYIRVTHAFTHCLVYRSHASSWSRCYFHVDCYSVLWRSAWLNPWTLYHFNATKPFS